MARLSIIIPVLNYEETLEPVVSGIAGIADEIIVPCDITKPSMEEEVTVWMEALRKKYGIKPLFRKNESGYGSATRLGFSKATGDVIIVMSGDNSDDPKTLTAMMEKIEEFDVVCGTRFSKGGGISGNILKERIARIISLMLRIFSRTNSFDITNGFRAYRAYVAKSVRTRENSFSFNIEMLIRSVECGYKVGEVPTVWRNRVSGKPNFQVKKEGKEYAYWTFYSVLKMPSAAAIALVALTAVAAIVML